MRSFSPAKIGCFIILVILAFPIVAELWTVTFNSHKNWQAPGPIQVLAGPDEIWCFIQVDNMVHHPGLLRSHPTFPRGRHQEVIIISQSGDVRRIAVSIENGVSFHPSSSIIFRLEGSFYLYQRPSMDTHRSVYRWETDHFQLLPLDESEALLKKQELDQHGPSAIDDAIDALSQTANWKRVVRNRNWWDQFKQPPFEWSRHTLSLKAHTHENTASLSLECAGEKPWAAELISCDITQRKITKSQFREIRDRPIQEANPRSRPD